MPKRGPATWISFDVDYLGGSYTNADVGYSCVKDCDNCHHAQGRPKTQILSLKETEENTMEMIYLIHNSNIQKAYLRQSHASIVDLLQKGDVVYNIDAHHDHYSEAFTKADVNCGNWVTWAWNHNILVDAECDPLEVLEYIEHNNKNPVYLFISLSPNYASPQTDTYLLDILMELQCKVDTDLRR